MFGFFKSKKQKRAKDLLGTAYKVYNYRCDIIDQADAKKLSSMIEHLEELIGDGKVGTKEYEAHADELEKLLGRLYRYDCRCRNPRNRYSFVLFATFQNSNKLDVPVVLRNDKPSLQWC